MIHSTGKHVNYDPMDERFACCVAAVKRVKTVPSLCKNERKYTLGSICKKCGRIWFMKKCYSEVIVGPYTVL